MHSTWNKSIILAINFLNLNSVFVQADKDKANFQKLVEAIQGSHKGQTIGEFSKDKFPGEFLDSWRSALSEAKMEKIDVSTPIAYIMAPKDEAEMGIIKKACHATMDLYSKFLKEQIIGIIDGEKVNQCVEWRKRQCVPC